ncbi:Nramp family divalent metal transporter [Dactylosporangium sp. AC04546]|uniref:Nramp family divalent metal transporter n=1 Tax=Dactylosporangium sp. AC04546 TaxID=2862460 RepID=UPI001EDCF6B3|nr:Nramp family divalent metal transporter [Dactylosporangium sp. AC04546]WVK79539.1 Nramp family divalent metal transporter [Dactylosporangium sp. AC04546]
MSSTVHTAGTATGAATLRQLRSRGRLRGPVALFGSAFVAAVAYVDPGNFATNLSAGARFGYSLVWVIVMANLMAMLVQYLSAKVGVATGRDLPELCRQHLPRPVALGLWVQAEIVAMATDLAEFVGAAVGLYLLFGVPLLPAGLLTAVVAFGVLALERRGYRRFELAIVGMLGIVFLGFLYDLVVVGVDPAGVARGLVPSLAGGDGQLMLVCGIIGATVMPHVIYLHSALTKSRVACSDDAERRELLRFQRLDVVIGLGAAGLINLSMLVVAASLFNANGRSDIDSIEAAHAGLGSMVGGTAALAFAVALLASGLSSSSVGTYAGQVVMQGFIRRRIPVFLRRLITMAPALAVLALGLPATDALVISQVVLSFGIPFALVPLLLLSRRRDIMGSFVNNRATNLAAAAIAGVIIALNMYLLWDTFL